MPDQTSNPTTSAATDPASSTASPTASLGHESSATTRAATQLSRKTPWTLKQNITRGIWMTLGNLLWRLLPPMRPSLIRMFGGKVGRKCSFGPRVEVTIPWNVNIGNNVRVREGAIIYSLGPITIGDDCVLDTRAHLCAGTHDMTDPTFPLVKPPITLGKGCLIGIDAYISPDVELGDGCRVWPRSSVYKDFPAGCSLKGNPAKAVDPDNEAREELERVTLERTRNTPQSPDAPSA